MFRFTIRELVLVTLVVAMAAGWWVDRSALAWRYAQSVATAESDCQMTSIERGSGV